MNYSNQILMAQSFFYKGHSNIKGGQKYQTAQLQHKTQHITPITNA